MTPRKEPAPVVCARHGTVLELLDEGNILDLWDQGRVPDEVKLRCYSHVWDQYALYTRPDGFLLEFIESHQAHEKSYRALFFNERPDRERMGKAFLSCLTGHCYACALMGDIDFLVNGDNSLQGARPKIPPRAILNLTGTIMLGVAVVGGQNKRGEKLGPVTRLGLGMAGAGLHGLAAHLKKTDRMVQSQDEGNAPPKP